MTRNSLLCCGLGRRKWEKTSHYQREDGQCNRITSAIRPIPSESLGRAVVDLHKREGSNLGLTVSGGADRGEAPVIASIRPGSIADRSDGLLVNDHILAINGMETISLRHEEIVRLVKNSGPQILLEIEYELPDLLPLDERMTSTKRTHVTLQRDGAETFGFTVRGGYSLDRSRCRPLTVMSVREGSATERDGRIKIGDRILAINGRPGEDISCGEAMNLMRMAEYELELFIEYDVAVVDARQRANYPVIIEIDKLPSERLGISLAPYHDVSGVDIFYIDNIREGSIADRCGALQVGDKVTAIDDLKVDNMTLQEAMHRVKSNVSDHIRLEVIPDDSYDKFNRPISAGGIPRAKSMPSGVSAFQQFPIGPLDDSVPQCSCAHPPGRPDGPTSQDTCSVVYSDYSGQHPHTKSSTSLHSSIPNSSTVSRAEQTEVSLAADDLGSFGFTVKGPTNNPVALLNEFPIVEYIQPSGAAYKSSVLQEGDRVVSVNHQSTLNRSLDEVNSQILSSGSTVTLITQFDVADTVVPSSGIFNVKLIKRCESLGINLQAVLGQRSGEPLLITRVCPGGVAHRSGSIQPGDLLLAVGGVPLETCSLAQAVSLLQASSDVVTLKIQKEDRTSIISDESDSPSVIDVDVEPNPQGHSWGIDLGHDQSHQVRIECLSPGLTSGRLQVGDILLAINGVPVQGRGVEWARETMQNCRARLNLRVARWGTRFDKGSNARKHVKSKIQTTPRLLELSSFAEFYASRKRNPSSGLPPAQNNLLSEKIPSTDSAVDLPDQPTTESDSDSHRSPREQTSTTNQRPHTLRATFDPRVRVIRAQTSPSEETVKRVGPQSIESLRLEHISCPGCREAIENEIRQQKQQCHPMTQSQHAHVNHNQNYENHTPHKQQTTNPRVHGNAIPMSMPSGRPVRQINSETRVIQPRPTSVSGGELDTLMTNSINGSFHSSNSSSRPTLVQDNNTQSQDRGARSWVRIVRASESESFGIGVSEGVSPKGIYMSALRAGSPAEQCGQVQVYDRILKVNNQDTENLSCSDVVRLISHSGNVLDLIIQRHKGPVSVGYSHPETNSKEIRTITAKTQLFVNTSS